MQTQTVEPARLTIADLEVIEAKETRRSLVPQRQPLSKHDATQRVLGGIKLIKFFYGGAMNDDVDAVDYLTSLVDQLEAEKAEQAKRFEAEKAALLAQHESEKRHYRKALAAVAKVLDLYSGDPFELKPISKWGKADLGKWMIAAGESIQWVMQRAENALDPNPDHVVPIAPDPE